MSATADLIQEHHVIERVLRALDRNVREAARTHNVPVAFLRNLVTFSQRFVDRCHHSKEEQCLYPCLERQGIPRDGGSIGVMLREHEIGPGLVRWIAEALDRYGRGTAGVEDVLVPWETAFSRPRTTTTPGGAASGRRKRSGPTSTPAWRGWQRRWRPARLRRPERMAPRLRVDRGPWPPTQWARDARALLFTIYGDSVRFSGGEIPSGKDG